MIVRIEKVTNQLHPKYYLILPLSVEGVESEKERKFKNILFRFNRIMRNRRDFKIANYC